MPRQNRAQRTRSEQNRAFETARGIRLVNGWLEMVGEEHAQLIPMMAVKTVSWSKPDEFYDDSVGSLTISFGEHDEMCEEAPYATYRQIRNAMLGVPSENPETTDV